MELADLNNGNWGSPLPSVRLWEVGAMCGWGGPRR